MVADQDLQGWVVDAEHAILAKWLHAFAVVAVGHFAFALEVDFQGKE